MILRQGFIDVLDFNGLPVRQVVFSSVQTCLNVLSEGVSRSVD